MPEQRFAERTISWCARRTGARGNRSWKRVADFPVIGMGLLLLWASPGAFAQEARPAGSQNVEKPPAKAESASQVNRISESQLVGLPLNGRSYSQLATLQAGVSDPSAANSARGVSTGGLTVSGGRRTSNSFLLDGTNIMNTQNEVPRSAAGVQLGSDAVLEVQVFGSQYSAEYGRGSGGVLNSITRSGTPAFHGSLFEFFRNNKLDARDYFDSEEPPPFRRNQFGFTLTGPLVKDRTFFLGSFEGLRDRLIITDTDYLPDLNARAGRITNTDGTVRNPCVYPTNRPYCVAESVRPYLEKVFPIPNFGSLGDGLGEHHGLQNMPTDESFFTVRVDHQMATRDSLFVRYTFDDASGSNRAAAAIFTASVKSRQQYFTLVESHIFSTSLVNAFRFGYTRPVNSQTSLSAIEIPKSLYFVPGAPQFGQLNIPGVTPFGPGATLPEASKMNSFQFANDVVWQRGSHSFKFGFQAHRYLWNAFNSWHKSGFWSFNSLESFLRAGPDGTSVEVALPESDNTKNHRLTLVGFYGQDTYTVSPGLQLDLGLRYEFTTLIHDKDGRDTYLLDPLNDATLQTGRFLEKNPSLFNVSPRVGLSWSPFGAQGMVIRTGAGIYYDYLLEYMVANLKDTAPYYQRAVRTNFDASGFFPHAAAAVAGVPPHLDVLDYKTSATPMVLRYDIAMQQELPGGVNTTISYVGARGNHLYRNFEANQLPLPELRPDGTLLFPAQCNKLDRSKPPHPNDAFCRTYAGPINRAFETISYTSGDAQSFYNSLRIALSKRIGQGVSLQGSYTFSKSVDDTSSDSAESGQYGWERKESRGLSDFDIRHRFIFNYFYTLPVGRGRSWLRSGVASHILGGWRLGGIVSWRSGTPFNATVNMRTAGYLFSPIRPNLLPGQSSNPTRGVSAGCGDVPAGQPLGTFERYFDPCVFAPPPPGTIGNAGRNTMIGPTVFNMDLSLQKEFSLDSKRRLQFRAEVFNLPNHTNFSHNTAGSAIVFRGASGARNPTAGRVGNTATTARQIQFALRLSF